jgi:hypothetical protein
MATTDLGNDVAHLLDFGEARGGQPGTGLAAVATAVAGTLSARVTLFCVGVAACTLAAMYALASDKARESGADTRRPSRGRA